MVDAISMLIGLVLGAGTLGSGILLGIELMNVERLTEDEQEEERE